MALASKWRGSKMLKSRVCQGAFHHNTARHGLLNRLVLDPLQLCTMLSYLYQDPIILQSNEIEWLDCITSPDSLGWAHKQTSALLLFEDEVSHCKDLSWCFARVYWLLRNRYHGAERLWSSFWTRRRRQTWGIALNSFLSRGLSCSSGRWRGREACNVCRRFNSCICCFTSGDDAKVQLRYFGSKR